jgi:hypothetical protein
MYVPNAEESNIERRQEKHDYLPRFLAVFLGLGVNGFGGVLSSRRSTSSALGRALGWFCVFMVGV